FLGKKCKDQSVRANHLQKFTHILELLAVASPREVKPSSCARVDLYTHALTGRKQPFSRCLRDGPGVEDYPGRYSELARDADFDGVFVVHCDCLNKGSILCWPMTN